MAGVSGVGGLTYVVLVITLIVVESMGQICMAASKVDGKMQYSHVSVVLLIEFTKLVVSAVGTTKAKIGLEASATHFSFSDNIKYAIPGFLYMVVNNMAFVIMQYIDPGTYSIMWNIKILYTALLLRCMMNKVLSSVQWGGIFVLIIGLVIVDMGHEVQDDDEAGLQKWAPPPPPVLFGDSLGAALPSVGSRALLSADVGGGQGELRELDAVLGVHSDMTAGTVMTLISAAVVALANVYCELLYKRNSHHSIHWQNLQLYMYGVVWNVMMLDWKQVFSDGLFASYNGWTLVVIATGSSSGLLISAVLKYIDNIAVVYAHAASMIAVTAASVLWFGLELTGVYALGGTVCIISVLMYHWKEIREASMGRRAGARAGAGAGESVGGQEGGLEVGEPLLVEGERGSLGAGGMASPRGRLGSAT